MLNDWLTEKTIQLADRVADWQAAVARVAQPLLTGGIISAGYVAAIYRRHGELGPYYVLAPGIAMPHARPEDGALALGLSLLCVKQGVVFHSVENDPVYLLVMLAAPDKHSHVKLIAELAALFADEQAVNAIRQADTIAAIAQTIAGCSVKPQTSK
ncbi:PTS sugar transporter subunit IIA [Martelella alba]|uniref:PTS sugar transporter subunit IIA n=1 Tax=Martelella alba TaxID=2590451 RepID=A0ABY2SG59_9HYPH|nr:PTS sugar transporter subunit IIA [Martelella alba]TKI03829.1 PTS sugar transporter subunit IIA [Martelella alba]